jgi:thiamine biosynthesis lipoprotein
MERVEGDGETKPKRDEREGWQPARNGPPTAFAPAGRFGESRRSLRRRRKGGHHVLEKAALVFACLAAGCSAPGSSDTRATVSGHLVERAGLTMGSELKLTAWTSDEAATQAVFDEVFKEFDRLDRLMSVWKEGSDILRLNAAAGDHAVPVNPDVFEALRIAHEIGDWTGGKFDVTFGALSDLWRFDQDQDDRIPDRDEVRRRLPLINYQALILDERAGTAFLQRKGMRAHLGGIGKGFAVERGVKIFRDHGLNDFMIQAGGDLYVGGKKGDRPWKLGLNDPRGADGSSFATIELSDATFSTSGDYERFFIKDGVRYHHILDPDTGEPARGCRSVTIVADRPVLADGLSTGVFVLGPEKGMALIERLPNVEGVIVTAKNEVLVSSGLKDRLTIVHPPTDAP